MSHAGLASYCFLTSPVSDVVRGFCVIVPSDASVVGQVEAAARAHGFDAQVIGHVIEDPARRVFLPQHGLVGMEDTFTAG